MDQRERKRDGFHRSWKRQHPRLLLRCDRLVCSLTSIGEAPGDQSYRITSQSRTYEATIRLERCLMPELMVAPVLAMLA